MEVENWGHIDYEKAQDRQQAYVQKVIEQGTEKIILCSHPPVVTLGKKAKTSDVHMQEWTGSVLKTKRGGGPTYHGPGQVIAYPIINLQYRNKDIYKYLRNLEKAVVETLKSYGLSSARGNPESTGVWIGERKMASIGVAMRRWITYHGLALNLYEDPLAFRGISPCGLGRSVMIHLEQLVNKKIPRREIEDILASHLCHLLRQ